MGEADLKRGQPTADTKAEPPGPRTPSRPTGRDRRLDALRGVFVLSMSVGHLAAGTVFDYLSHPLRWVDGASGFVLFSGLVLGLVLRRRTHGAGDRGRGDRAAIGYAYLWRRARYLWVAHVLLTVAVLAARTGTGRPAAAPSVGDLGGWVPALLGVATLRVQPPYLNVLPLYVVLLGGVAPLVLLGLRRGWWAVPLLGSGVLYAVGQWQPRIANPDTVVTTSGTWAWASWQVLFVGGLVAGWHWRATLRPWLVQHRRVVVPLAAVVTLVLGLLANVYDLAGGAGSWASPFVATAFEKYALRPGVIVLLVTATIVGYAALGRARADRVDGRATHALATIGARSLDCYLLLSVVQQIVLGWWPVRPLAATGLLLAATIVVMHTLARARTRAQGTAETPARGGSAPEAPAAPSLPAPPEHAGERSLVRV